MSQHDRALEPLDRVGAIQALVPFLSGEVSPKERSFKPSGGHERGEKQQVTALFTLGNLCKGKKTRQEKAALAGAVSPLVELSRRYVLAIRSESCSTDLRKAKHFFLVCAAVGFMSRRQCRYYAGWRMHPGGRGVSYGGTERWSD